MLAVFVSRKQSNSGIRPRLQAKCFAVIVGSSFYSQHVVRTWLLLCGRDFALSLLRTQP